MLASPLNYHIKTEESNSNSPPVMMVDAEDEGEEKLNCHVCGEDISDQNQQIHYGAVACFSCRAFFRRAQGLKRPLQSCKNDNACVMNVETRRFCGSCRLNACITAGMNPNAVLSEDQKRHRFRRMLKRKREESERKRDDKRPEATVTEVSFFEKFILDLHKDANAKAHINMTFLSVMYSIIKDRAASMASQVPEVWRLNFLSREVVLLRRLPKLAQLLVCRYFAASSGSEQISILLPHFCPRNSIKPRLLTLNNFARDRSLFGGRVSLMLNCYIDKLDHIVPLLQSNEIDSKGMSKIEKALLFDQNPHHPLNEVEGLVHHRVNALANYAKFFWIVNSSVIIRDYQDRDFWDLVSDRVRLTTSHMLTTCSQVEDFEAMFRARAPLVFSLYLIRLNAADSYQSQLRTITENHAMIPSQSQDKVQIFRLCSNKHLLQRTMIKFEDLAMRFNECFVTEEMFKLFILLAIFWDVDGNATGDGQHGHMDRPRGGLTSYCGEIFDILTTTCHQASNDLPRPDVEKVLYCLNELDYLTHFCNNFATFTDFDVLPL